MTCCCNYISKKVNNSLVKACTYEVPGACGLSTGQCLSSISCIMSAVFGASSCLYGSLPIFGISGCLCLISATGCATSSQLKKTHKDYLQINSEYKLLKHEIKARNSSYLSLAKQHNESMLANKRLVQDIANSNAECDDLSKKLFSVTSEYTQFTNNHKDEVSSLNDKIAVVENELSKTKTNLNDVSDKLTVCVSSLNEKNQEISELQAENSQLVEQQENLIKQIDTKDDHSQKMDTAGEDYLKVCKTLAYYIQTYDRGLMDNELIP